MGPVLRILAAAFLWSTIGVAASLGREYLWIAFFRSLTASLAALAAEARPGRGALLPGLLLGGLFTVYPAAAIYAGIGNAAYLLYTAPLWTALALALWGERPSRRDGVGVALVFAAVALMASSGGISGVGFAAGLASGLFYGLYIAAARRLAAGGRAVDASLGAMPYTLAVTAPALLLKPSPPTLEAAAAGVYLGVFGTVLPYRLFASAVSRVGGAKASVLASLEPVLAALWGALFFGQRPTAPEAAAYVLITAAAVAAARK
ncbi:DMT family transporter [Pyrobaculum neutrophilum]|uniref:EamA domain-containing protein n=1 Tax=Pyrobaculum neutrophilum (strain DSM 2338 / JCM 9278 / NBRC 100436 / V24Sta) TaxID=444157 RepID=B1YCG4_PYRNV|nr:DMT family transporter [Pyrobaculum neutrophilum]ACB39477.1 protein of unknown function DUF6 transmembrane [Pyrobaculum neutrophilum V24Sta]